MYAEYDRKDKQCQGIHDYCPVQCAIDHEALLSTGSQPRYVRRGMGGERNYIKVLTCGHCVHKLE